jgi:DNA-binding winged helix-turn-helix (wHTH) protein
VSGIKGVYNSNELEIDLDRRELSSGGSIVKIGNRAFEIIEILVQSRGQLVEKAELMRRVWPHAIVEENASALRKALRRDHILLRTVSGRGYRLIGNWTSTLEAADKLSREPAVIPLGTFLNNLPTAIGSGGHIKE